DQWNSTVSSNFRTAFTDENQIALWAVDAVRLMSEKGIMIGTGSGIFNPSGYATREQAMVMIYRSYGIFIAPSDTMSDDVTEDVETEYDDEDDYEDGHEDDD
ncbi:MAG: S-layer homology domain-containing protein, partial [Victivallales bacterium]|nr:S-layer homology domain-containing protein [Victivallales bacterium]